MLFCQDIRVLFRFESAKVRFSCIVRDMKLCVDHSYNFLFNSRRFDNTSYHFQEKII